MKKRSFVQKITHFLNGKGFYIALACCIAVIGVSGWYLWKDLSTASQLAAEVGRAETVVVEPETFAETQTAAPQLSDTDPADESDYDDEEEEEEEAEESESPDGSDSDESPEAEATTAPNPIKEEPVAETQTSASSLSEEVQEAMEPVHGWLWPLDGAVCAAFSSDTLTYNKALGDWRTHSGIDLSAQLGQCVTAACAGTVISVREDALLGQTVVMDCGNGLTVSYSNLAEDVAVSAGESLSAGDLIGTVGETAAGEVSDTPWLHFAVFLNDEAVDPSGYLQ